MPKRVAVIGAGPSGLVTVKELLEEGHSATCFEKADGLGGVFRFGEKDGVVWESCRLTSSGLLTAFSDFPVTPDRSGHMNVGEYVDYLNNYCDAFDVKRHIRFGTKVESVTQNLSCWTVQVVDSCGTRTEHFDSVAICSGLHQHPHIPNFPGQETFTGSILHGAEYRRPAQVSGKRVLIVGAGESGADVVSEVSEHADETVLSLRRGVAVQARRMFGQPRDYQTSRILNSAAHWVFQTRNPEDNRKRNIYRIVFFPFLFIDKFLQLFYRYFWEYLPLLFSTRLSEIKTNVKTMRMMLAFLKESGGTVNEQFGTKTHEFVRAIVLGKCRRAPGIARFEGSRVYFDDGSVFEPDLVILCTGFQTKAPFLDPAIAEAPRYLHTFHPEKDASLGFIGFLRPAYGAIPPLAELQARWFALLQSERLKLPAKEKMMKSIDQWTKYRAHIFRAVRGRLDHLVDHTPFCDELASQVGCKPTWRTLRNETFAFRLKFFAAAFVSAQYRLTGPHAKPAIAREVIQKLPIMHPLPDLINLYLRWTLSRILHRILGPQFSPKLEIQEG